MGLIATEDLELLKYLWVCGRHFGMRHCRRRRATGALLHRRARTSSRFKHCIQPAGARSRDSNLDETLGGSQSEVNAAGRRGCAPHCFATRHTARAGYAPHSPPHRRCARRYPLGKRSRRCCRMSPWVPARHRATCHACETQAERSRRNKENITEDHRRVRAIELHTIRAVASHHVIPPTIRNGEHANKLPRSVPAYVLPGQVRPPPPCRPRWHLRRPTGW
jgi:hypothetical protein